MKFKVILFNEGDAQVVDEMANFTFYTSSQAQLCCQRWVERETANKAYYWNGDTWYRYE